MLITCCHTEIEVTDQTFYLTQSQCTDTGPTSPNADPISTGMLNRQETTAKNCLPLFTAKLFQGSELCNQWQGSEESRLLSPHLWFYFPDWRYTKGSNLRQTPVWQDRFFLDSKLAWNMEVLMNLNLYTDSCVACVKRMFISAGKAIFWGDWKILWWFF